MKVRLHDNSGWRIYRYLVRDVDKYGKTRLYFRRLGHPPKILLTAIPGTADFEAEYQRAFARAFGDPAPAPCAQPNKKKPLQT
jgi:hypothetical protein